MKTVRFVLALLALSLLAPLQSAKAADVICYNCPPEWADWASMLKAIKTDLNYDIPHDNKNSGQALAQILAEKSNPVGDIGYFGVTFGMKAKAEGALEPYKPANWDQVAPGLKDPDGYWTSIHRRPPSDMSGRLRSICRSAAPRPISSRRSPSSRNCARTIRSSPNRHPMPAWFPERCRSCWIMISTPIVPNIPRRAILNS